MHNSEKVVVGGFVACVIVGVTTVVGVCASVILTHLQEHEVLGVPGVVTDVEVPLVVVCAKVVVVLEDSVTVVSLEQADGDVVSSAIWGVVDTVVCRVVDNMSEVGNFVVVVKLAVVELFASVTFQHLHEQEVLGTLAVVV